jgi:hypothetical protein
MLHDMTSLQKYAKLLPVVACRRVSEDASKERQEFRGRVEACRVAGDDVFNAACEVSV